MSEVADLTNAGRLDILPGYTLCRPGIEELGMAEQQCAGVFLATVRRSTDGLPAEEKAAELEMAQKRIADGKLAFGSDGFTAWAFQQTSAPFLILLTALRKQPKTTYPDVCAVYNAARAKADGSDWQIHKGVLELFDYSFGKKGDAGEQAASASSGTSSSAIAASLPPSDSESAPNSSAT